MMRKIQQSMREEKFSDAVTASLLFNYHNEKQTD